MTLSLQDLSDRAEIQDLIVAYSYAVDTRDFDALEALFTPDAFIDYTAMGGISGDPATIKQWLGEVMPFFSTFQHFAGLTKITLLGDEAETVSMCHNPMTFAHKDGTTHTWTCGLWYHDRFLRTPDGWRMTRRVEEKGYFTNLPPGMPEPGT